jgi:inner membrane transporter RhtA
MSEKDSNNDGVAAGRAPIVALSSGIAPEFLAIGSMLSVQLGAALAVPVMATIGPAPTTALRPLWAGIMLTVIVRPRFSTMTRRQWLASGGLGMTIAVLTFCYFCAISRIPMGPATAIEFLGPLGVALIGTRRFLHLILAVVAAIGVLFLTREHSHWSVDASGIGFATVAALGWATYIMLMKRVGASFPGLQGLSIALLVAAIAVMPVSFVARGNVLSPAPLLSTVGLAVLSPL